MKNDRPFREISLEKKRNRFMEKACRKNYLRSSIYLENGAKFVSLMIVFKRV